MRVSARTIQRLSRVKHAFVSAGHALISLYGLFFAGTVVYRMSGGGFTLTCPAGQVNFGGQCLTEGCLNFFGNIQLLGTILFLLCLLVCAIAETEKKGECYGSCVAFYSIWSAITFFLIFAFC